MYVIALTAYAEAIATLLRDHLRPIWSVHGSAFAHLDALARALPSVEQDVRTFGLHANDRRTATYYMAPSAYASAIMSLPLLTQTDRMMTPQASFFFEPLGHMSPDYCGSFLNDFSHRDEGIELLLVYFNHNSNKFIAVKPDYIQDVRQLRKSLTNANGKLNHAGWSDHRIFRNPTTL